MPTPSIAPNVKCQKYNEGDEMSRKLNDSLELKTHIVDNSWHTLLHFKHRLRTHGPRLVMFHFPQGGGHKGGRKNSSLLETQHEYVI